MEKINHRALVAAVILSTIGFLFYNVMPIYLGHLMDSKNLDYDQTGYMGSAFFLAFSIPSASAYFWVNQIRPKNLSLASIFFICVFLYLSTITNSYMNLMLEILFVGSFSGILAAVAIAILDQAKNQTRWFSVKTASESAAGTILLLLLPATLIASYGFNGVVYGMLIFIATVTPLVLSLSNSKLDVENKKPIISETSKGDLPKTTFRVIFALLAVFCNFVTGSSIWAFAERIADIRGFDPIVVGNALGMTLAFAIIGPAVSGLVSDRFGIKVPFLIFSVLMLFGAYGISASSNLTGYIMAACLNMFGWAASIPFMYSLVSNADPNGRFITLVASAVGLGSVVGPAIAGNLFGEQGSMLGLQLLVLVFMSLSITCGLKSFKPSDINHS